MLNKLYRSTQIYYFTCIILLMSAFTYGVYVCWDQKIFDEKYNTKLSEVTFLIKELDQAQYIKKIEDLSNNDQTRMAVKVFDDFEHKLSVLISFIQGRSKNYKELESILVDLNEDKNNLAGIVSLPEVKDIKTVFHNKLNDFNDFVSNNKWRTLTRISSKVIKYIKSQDNYKYSTLKKLYRALDQDVRIMMNVTEGSVLSKLDKSSILLRLKRLKVEVDMFEKYINVLKDFQLGHKNFNIKYQKWLKEIIPVVRGENDQIKLGKKVIFMGALALIGIMALLLVGGVIIYLKNGQIVQGKIEDIYIDVIKNSLISGQTLKNQGFSLEFKNEIEKYHHYIQKRISFTKIFHKTLPFPAMLLDSNLKLIWANQLFCDTFELKNFQLEKENLSWDYFLRFTNLIENDPVLEAMEKNLAGIYQALIKLNQNSVAIPFEMYVTPFSKDNNMKVMVYFYPLMSLEETITNQGKSLLGPIRKTLDALSNNQFNLEFQKEIVQDFTLAGTSDIYEKVLNYYQLVTSQRQGLLKEIDKLEDELNDQHKLVHDITKNVHLNDKNFQNFLGIIGDLKKEIITFVDKYHDISDANQQSFYVLKDIFKQYKTVLETFITLYEKLEVGKNTVISLNKLRSEFKVLKSNLKIINSKLKQSVDQALVFERTEEVEENKISHSFNKIKNDVTAIDIELKKLEKIITGLDVQLSKAEMELDLDQSKYGKGQFEIYSKFLGKSEKDIEEISFERSKVLQNQSKTEDAIVSSIGTLFSSYKNCNQTNRDMKLLLSAMDHIVESAEDDLNDASVEEGDKIFYSSNAPYTIPTSHDVNV